MHRPGAQEGYRFSKAMENPGFIGTADIRERYLPLGFFQFQAGRARAGQRAGAGVSALLSDPAGVSDPVREAIYLDNMLDLF